MVVLRGVVKALLSLRYRIEVRGLEAVRARGDRKILFLPNHPALIDPVIVMAALHKDFHPRPLANAKRTDLPVIGWMARRVGTVLIPDLMAPSRREMREVARGLNMVRRVLDDGANILLYPGGQLSREPVERLGGKGAVDRLLKAVPDARVVLVRQRGLWGSSFSWGFGREPHVLGNLPMQLAALAAAGIVGLPRRTVVLELDEPGDFPRDGGRAEVNAYLERFYNATPNPVVRVPYFWWRSREGA
ncbi:1-acyl-sn-glycerol-3-phosphate acyltransferase [Desulfovibrio aminophilus]|nr:lysophospholipid acyltransferase family protein [Desulfovibrio aminophilus]MCM0754831.1 1-acyl-sn-glycerol-3-phosphate acyltransferase [Desulfovibrio aminophilus]